MSDIQLLAKCYDDLIQGMIQANIKLLNEVLDDSFVLILTTGDKTPKKDWLASIEKKEMIYHTANTEHVEITPKGDNAIVLGQTHVEVTSTRHPRMPFNLQQTLKAVKKGEKWHFIESAAAVY